MAKVKTFGEALKVFQTHRELSDLDEQVNKFIADNKVRVISVSDAVVPGPEGCAQGIIRVLAYE